ncbi:uncharacterized protein JN550_012070 [Neoarthrinium moseri]|uniref:uncharacterized protein n=1 Tax=Neoarthrinium moseri TaxID=1658444 RepID=UPI001FDC8905|nr:uncharacterized protein JN550_012070 [Neoarthrinium moseri]KAI1859261.1 hypothetical protein JN550_012070 [Neoarthrinium moseri]
MEPASAAGDDAAPVTLAEQLGAREVHPQRQSPLYGRIPAELRDHIFRYALEEFCPPEAQARLPTFSARCYRHGEEPPSTPEYLTAIGDGQEVRYAGRRRRETRRGYDWVRPDCPEPTAVAVALLATCRAVYLETHALPLMLREHRFYLERGPPHGVGSVAGLRAYFEEALSGPAPVRGLRQRDLVRSVRFFVQLFWLEDANAPYHFWHLATATPWLRPVERLRITVRRADWWHWESNTLPAINPFRGTAGNARMHQDMRAGDGNHPFADRVWGLAFQHMPNLQTLVMDFETSEDLKAELDDILRWAVKWRLPLSGGRFLSAAGQPVEMMRWRGSDYHWSDYSPRDYRSATHRENDEPHGFGPRLYTGTVTWTACSEEPVRSGEEGGGRQEASER